MVRSSPWRFLLVDYVDDINSVEPAFSAQSGLACWRFLVGACGLVLDPRKTSTCATPSFDSLGVTFHLQSTAGLLEILRRRAEGLAIDLQAILRSDCLTPGQAARLRGRLGFAVVAAFGRFGRAQMSAIKRRQFGHPASLTPAHRLTPQLVACLHWWVERLHSLPPRSLPPSPSQHFYVAYSDGEGTGQVAVSLTLLDRQTEFCCARVPQSVFARWGGDDIQRIEACGPAICLLTWPSHLQGSLLLFFIDNKSALGSLVGGWSNEQVVNDLTALTWRLAAEARVFVHFEWVE